MRKHLFVIIVYRNRGQEATEGDLYLLCVEIQTLPEVPGSFFINQCIPMDKDYLLHPETLRWLPAVQK